MKANSLITLPYSNQLAVSSLAITLIAKLLGDGKDLQSCFVRKKLFDIKSFNVCQTCERKNVFTQMNVSWSLILKEQG